ncbi:MAG: AarF/ABC1/UbiB kinase family protein [Rhodobacteraceae bacterium]|nr:AarF/ABC1/UbiB kinase family protein [Paracoccaceae bacterium]
MATGVAGAMLVDGVGRLSRGERPSVRDLFLTPGNIGRVTDQLARMRGAAMKVGQLVSMDPGEMLPPELAEIMARLRADADHMPPKQLRDVLDANWGRGWRQKFAKFDVRPIAAASIGQVHRATLPDGRVVAVKVQYPGVRASIDSDVANVGALMKMSGLVPTGMAVGPLLDEAKRQLREEADYAREAGELSHFGALLIGDDRFLVPGVVPELSTEDVLVMEFAEGVPIEDVASADQATRDHVAETLIALLLRELFEFRAMQTDPNFANYRYNPETGQIVLLDFGATRYFSTDLVAHYRALMAAGLNEDRAGLRTQALQIGFFDASNAPHHQDGVLDMMEIAFDLLRSREPVAPGDPELLRRMRAAGEALAMDREFVHVPPMDVLYLQRKFAGMFLLCAKLQARVALRPLLEAYL